MLYPPPSHPPFPSSHREGFSLLEVMVAIALLGLVLTAVLTAQGGIFARNRSAANVAKSALLGRCKMTELEETLQRRGYPLTDLLEKEIPCCEGEKNTAFRCDTRIETVELPPPSSQLLNGDGGLQALTSAPSADASPALQMTPLHLDGGTTSLTASLPGGGVSGMLKTVMTTLYPSFKQMMETSIRKITVRVHWKEGLQTKEFTLVQYVTRPSNIHVPQPPTPNGQATGSTNPTNPSPTTPASPPS